MISYCCAMGNCMFDDLLILAKDEVSSRKQLDKDAILY